MCGIAGVLTTRDGAWEDVVRRMTDRLTHRGPDAQGLWADPAAGIWLGHRRLSIIDRSERGAQPMRSSSGRFVITYNGEIYNAPEIRARLGALGLAAPFRGHSDTEVLLAAIERWGLRAAIERSVGMFAFALWDAATRTLTLGRDRMGEKPLYYGWIGGAFAFASELDAFRDLPGWAPEIDRTALDHLLRFQCVPAPRSIYHGVAKLAPGMLHEVRHGAADAIPQPYWSVTTAAEAGARQRCRGSAADAADELALRLGAAVRGQMIADVPLGAFLSGGIDSSTIVALMQLEASRPVRTFTIGFGIPGYDEARYARRIAAHLGTDHTELYVGGDEALQTVPHLAAIFSEPFADPSQIPTAIVARLARQHVTVCLSGDGGDELFGGYPRYRSRTAVQRLLDRVPSGLRAPLARMALDAPARSSTTRHRLDNLGARLAAHTRTARYEAAMSQWKNPKPLVLALAAAQPWARETSVLPDVVTAMLCHDAAHYLPDDILVKVDRASMAVGLEARAPYLDHRVVELAARLPLELKIRNGQGKWILRQVLGRYVPPPLFERPKHGFGPPIRAWLRGPLHEWAEDLLAPSALRRQGYVDVNHVRTIWGELGAGVSHWAPVVWSLLMFQAWLERVERGSSSSSAPDAPIPIARGAGAGAGATAAAAAAGAGAGAGAQ